MSEKWTPKRRIDRLLYRLDLWHHRHKNPWYMVIFCDLWDWRAGMSFRQLMSERWCKIRWRDIRTLYPLGTGEECMTDIISAISEVIGYHIPLNLDYASGCDCGAKVSGVDWRNHLAEKILQEIRGLSTDETDTTLEQFEEMWQRGEPVETVIRTDLVDNIAMVLWETALKESGTGMASPSPGQYAAARAVVNHLYSQENDIV